MNGIKNFTSFLGTTSVPVMNMLNNLVFPLLMLTVTGFLFVCIFRCVINLNSNNDETHKKGKTQIILILISIVILVLGPLVFWGILSSAQAIVEPAGNSKSPAPQGLNSILNHAFVLNTKQLNNPASMLYV